MKHLNHLNKYLIKYRSGILLGIGFIVIANFFALVPAQVIGHAFDLIKENMDIQRTFSGTSLQSSIFSLFTGTLLLFGLLVIALAFLRGVFMFFMRQTIIVVSRKIEYDLKNEIYAHFQKLSMAFFKRNQTGDLMARITEDVSRVRMYLGPAIMYSINLTVLFVMVITTMMYVNTELTLYVLIPLPILSISIYFVSNRINKKSELIQAKLSSLNSFAQRMFSGIRVVKSFVQENQIQKDFEREGKDYMASSLALAKTEAMFFPLMILLIGLSTILIIFVGGLKVMSGDITGGNIAEFIIYINMLTWPVTAVGWIAAITQRAAASQKRINEFLYAKPEIDSGQHNLDSITGAIEFNQVGFTYEDTGIEALKDFTLAIQPGEKLAIVGRTGAGKSTMANLLVRMYDVNQGSILVDGNEIRTLNTESLRKLIGYVPQDPFLFSDTIANNITFGSIAGNGMSNKKIMGDIEQAAANAGILKEIQSLPNGFETRIGERGVTLSGGQKQRLTIARTLFQNPNLIILDDCLSAVDTKTEALILQNLDKQLAEKTTIIITHRVLALSRVSRIIVMDDGKITEKGTHQELMHDKGLYFALYQRQLLQEQRVSG